MSILNQKKNKLMALFLSMRPIQWIKNGFVIVPLLFSGQFQKLNQCMKTILVFLAFCSISSAIYIINDLCDRPMDHKHPIKRYRPIASGVVSTTQALILSLVLIFVSIFTSVILSWKILSIVILYLFITIAYSLKLKHVVIIDVMIVATGFVLRIFAGSAAISVEPSHWMVLCTILISLFLGFAKRRAEIVNGINSQSNLGSSRIVLNDYSIIFLDQIIPIVAGATIVCYALYTVDARTLEVFGTRAMLITIPCVIYGILRYIYILYNLKHGEDPARILIKDIPMFINIVVWIVLSILVVIFGESVTLF